MQNVYADVDCPDCGAEMNEHGFCTECLLDWHDIGELDD